MGWRVLAGLALAGALGTLARYGMTLAVQRLTGAAFPWGTVAVNVIGCFLFGLVWMTAERGSAIGPEWRLVVLTGFMGAFTTFSTFAFETTRLVESEAWWVGPANLLVQNIVGLAAVMAGFAVARGW